MSVSNNGAESRHYNRLWNEVICKVLTITDSECDEAFREACKLHIKPPDILKDSVETQYRIFRKEFKELCYGNKNDAGLLDARKIAAVLCNTLIKQKPFVFDESAALSLISSKKEELPNIQFNFWVVNNAFINYKLAYLASLQLIYLTLLDDLFSSGETEAYAAKLNSIGHLRRYPISPDSDSIDVSIVIDLARADMNGMDFDMLLFAMQLYQMEIYAREGLKHNENFY